MTLTAPEPLQQALEAVGQLMDRLPAKSMLIGGIAVIANGHVRTTDDIDATISAQETSARYVLEQAAALGITPRIPDALAFAERNQILLLNHTASRVDLDLSLAWLPFEERALEHCRTISFHGRTLRICHPEDLVIYKLVAARPIDMEDARQLVLLHHSDIDRRRVEQVLREFDLVLEDDRSRVALWEHLARSAYPC